MEIYYNILPFLKFASEMCIQQYIKFEDDLQWLDLSNRQIYFMKLVRIEFIHPIIKYKSK